jgi:hypothetical protein
MDAIDSLLAGTRRAERLVDGAAQQVAATDLPTARNLDPANPVAPAPPRTNDVDVAAQLVTMTLAADVHHVTTAALRSAFSLYHDSLELLRPQPSADPSGLDS